MDVYKNVLGGGEFLKNRHSEGHSLLKGVNEFVHLISTVIAHFGEIQCKRSVRNTVEHL
jgi:hypothetical protein